MRKRLGAIANYKAAIRRIRRERRKPAPIATPNHLASVAMTVQRGNDGLWRVWSQAIGGPPFRPARCEAGPFDTRDEAQEWIDQ